MLNNIQKQLLTAAVEHLFEAICDCEQFDLSTKALQAIKDNNIYQVNRNLFIQYQLIEVVDELRRIYSHPCPQNRTTGNPYIGQEQGMVVTRDHATGQIHREPIGILSLTAQHDKAIPLVTRLDVLQHC
jgi:hypothetical protein